jgi:alkylation response protein AidB-like acyl-CoA dehydrogenase
VLGTLGFGLVLDVLGDDELRARHIPAVSRGEIRGVAAVASPWDAEDLAPTLSATRVGADWQVSGVVRYVVDADVADLVLACAATDDGRTVGVLVRPGATAAVEQLTTTAGDRYARLHVDATLLPADVLVGPGGAGLAEDDVRRAAHVLRVMSCLELVGVAEAILDRTVDYTRGREQFGRAIASFQAAQHLVADMHIDVQAARLTAQSAAYWLGRGDVATRQTAIAVVHAAQAGRRASLDAHQLHGGMGYVLETDLHLWSERARELGVLGGGLDAATRWLEREVVDA